MLLKDGTVKIKKEHLNVEQAKTDTAFTVHFPITPHIFRHSKSMYLMCSPELLQKSSLVVFYY